MDELNYEENIPEEAVSDIPNTMILDDDAECPECGSNRLEVSPSASDNNNFKKDVTCLTCGATFTD